MAEEKYVCIDKFVVTKIFDQAYKSKALDFMRKTATKMVDKSRKLTTKTKNKKEKGFYLGGSLKLLKGDKGGKILLVGEAKMQMATWPEKSMFAFPSGKAMVEILNEAKIERDMEDLLYALFRSLVEEKAVKEFEKRAKK
jgi:hypothetical protein